MSDRDHIKKLINNHTHRLQTLEEQEAFFGRSADPAVQMEIREIRAKIQKLRTKLEKVDDVSESTLWTRSLKRVAGTK